MSAPVRALLFKEVRESRWKLIIVSLVLIVLGASVPMLYDLLVDMLRALATDPSVPQVLLDLIPADLMEMSTYLWYNWQFKSLYQTLVIVALIFGAGAVAGEFGRGTAPFLFSRAVRRRTVLLVKLAVDLVGLAAAALLGTVALDIAARLMHGHAVDGLFYAALLPMMAGTAFVYGLALVVSARMDDPIKAGMAAAVVAALFSIPSFAPNWRHLSVYVQMSGRWMPQTGTVPWLAMVVMGVLAAALVASAVATLERRDI